MTRSDLEGRVIDAHAHVGVSLQLYTNAAFPFCQSLEGLYYKHKACGVDAGIVFPYSADLHFEWEGLTRGACAPAREPVSPAPYEAENRLLLKEVFQFCPELSSRFLPFVCVDPERDAESQVRALEALDSEYPVYGVKIAPVLVQSRLAGLYEEGRPLLELIEDRGWPVLCHVTADKKEAWSRPEVALDLAREHPRVRFCLAHCIGFDRSKLEDADALPNVWVDTAALKIQVELAHMESPIMAPPGERFDTDYSDHKRVMRDLADAFPDTLIWGSDSPAYSYICDRVQGGRVVEFRLKGTYEQEVDALNALDAATRRRVSSTNTLAFVFGPAPE